MRSALLVFVLFASLVIGADVPLRVGGSETVPEWTIGKLKVDAPKASAAYVWDIIPVHPLADDAASIVELGNEVLFTGPPGKYRFVCTEILIVDGKPVVNRQRSTVTITPNGDHPNPPAPSDLLLGKLKAIYKPNADNNERVKRLQAIYKVAASNTCNDPALTGLLALYRVVMTASANEVPLPTLQAEREIIAAELREKLPTKDEPLTTALRKQVADQFSRVASVLGELAK